LEVLLDGGRYRRQGDVRVGLLNHGICDFSPVASRGTNSSSLVQDSSDFAGFDCFGLQTTSSHCHVCCAALSRCSAPTPVEKVLGDTPRPPAETLRSLHS